MSRVEAAAAIDRLPWLPDEPSRPASRPNRNGVLLAGGLTLGVAAAGFWIGTQTLDEAPPAHLRSATTTVRLPQPRAAVRDVPSVPREEVRFAPAEEVSPVEPSEVRLATPRAQQSTVRQAVPSTAGEDRGASVANDFPLDRAPSTSRAGTKTTQPRPWPPSVTKGAAGRLVEVGAFGSVRQAKLGWRHMARDYPAMSHLPAVVRSDRNSKGRLFYRFRVGTTSQAHSEVVCQRLARIHLSCAVVGLPKAKVGR